MSKKTTITVAIPSFNKEKEIKRTLDSIIKENSSIDAIILVDNHSEDNTFTIAQTYEPLVTCYQNETNIGQARNWSRCVELCKTDWLMIVHADDELLPKSIAHYRAFIKKYPSVGMVHADAYSVIEGDISTKSYGDRHSKEFYIAGKEAMYMPFGVCSTVMVKKTAYEKLGTFIPDSLSSDYEMWSRIASKFDVGSLSIPTAIYHHSLESTGPQSLITRTFTEIKKDWDSLNAGVLAAFENKKERDAHLTFLKKSASANYWPVLSANIRARNWQNIFATTKFIMIDCNGSLFLIKKVLTTVYKTALKLIHKA